jgi:hypothetical protein
MSLSTHLHAVNVFLPSMKGTKLSFLRDILADKKLHLKQNVVIRLEVPAYQELSVKNLYDDAMQDAVLSKYLPTKEQLSGNLPECEFFFSVLCTLRNQYMKDIIEEAMNKRFKLKDDDPQNDGIEVTEAWFQEIMKHPYHSSKHQMLALIEKSGTGIFLMKEKAKLQKQQRNRTVHQVGKRLHPEEEKIGVEDDKNGAQDKRKNLGGGKAQQIPAQVPFNGAQQPKQNQQQA